MAQFATACRRVLGTIRLTFLLSSPVTISDVEFIAIVRAAASTRTWRTRLPPWAKEMRLMFDALEKFEFSARQATPLQKLAECGARYGWQKLETTIRPQPLAQLSEKAKRRLKNDLQRILARVTRPCCDLELKAFGLALEAISFQGTAASPKTIERNFLRTMPSDRLFQIFKKFPVLARLWSELISQWCDQVTELLVRFARDKSALSRTFFFGKPLDRIVDMRCGLSDPHNGGRTVMLLQCGPGAVIYKPRSGAGEWEWHKLLQWMNAGSFQPKLKAARVLRRKNYCWMEEVPSGSCKDHQAARRFYLRLGGMIGAAYLLKMVDCHRDNIIASGEHPVLVDAETPWHVAGESEIRTPLDILFQTGFLSKSDRRSSWQYRSSVLGKSSPGQHTPRIGTNRLKATRYEREIITGFRRAWLSILGSADRRAAFARRLRHLRHMERRWIYWWTMKYDSIRRASIQPAAIRSRTERDILIRDLCARSKVPDSVIYREINALKRFDIPYFTRRIGRRLLPDKMEVQPPLSEAIRRALHLEQ